MAHIGNELMWTEEKTSVFSSAQRALDKCKKQEEDLLAKGYRFFNVGKITQILVPCDKHGKPTKEGLEKIRYIKEHLGI